jgi:hypothetical protein
MALTGLIMVTDPSVTVGDFNVWLSLIRWASAWDAKVNLSNLGRQV